MSEQKSRTRSRQSDSSNFDAILDSSTSFPDYPGENKSQGENIHREVDNLPPSSQGRTSSSASTTINKQRYLKPLIALGVAAAIGVGAFIGFAGGGDQVSSEEEQSRITQYESLVGTGGLPVAMVSAEDVEQAIEQLPPSVTTDQKENIRSDISQGRVELAWLTLWDTHAEDGDVLRFESVNSIPIEVTALNAKTTIAIPYPAGGSVLVTGVKDGGGGITIALESGATQVMWPTMQPGDTLNLPVTPAY